MLAIIKTGGKQYIAAPGKKLKIEKLEGKEGDQILFEDVLLVAEGKNIKVGQPFVSGSKVIGKILEQGKSDKVIIMKFKSKKRHKVKRGHRQPFSLVEIESIK